MKSQPETLRSPQELLQLLRTGADPSVRAAALVLAYAATGRLDQLPAVYDAAVGCAVPPSTLREATLMVPLFAGYPTTIEAFHILDAHLPEAEPPAPPSEEMPLSARHARGEHLFERVYGRHASAVRTALVALHPELEAAVIEDAYGRVLGRPGLDARVRELMAVCALAATPLPRQLKSHLFGALRCGAETSDLREMYDLARFVDEHSASSVEPLFDGVVSPDSDS